MLVVFFDFLLFPRIFPFSSIHSSIDYDNWVNLSFKDWIIRLYTKGLPSSKPRPRHQRWSAWVVAVTHVFGECSIIQIINMFFMTYPNLNFISKYWRYYTYNISWWSSGSHGTCRSLLTLKQKIIDTLTLHENRLYLSVGEIPCALDREETDFSASHLCVQCWHALWAWQDSSEMLHLVGLLLLAGDNWVAGFMHCWEHSLRVSLPPPPTAFA